MTITINIEDAAEAEHLVQNGIVRDDVRIKIQSIELQCKREYEMLLREAQDEIVRMHQMCACMSNQLRSVIHSNFNVYPHYYPRHSLPTNRRMKYTDMVTGTSALSAS